MDYFESVIKKINNKKIISITKLDVKTCENDYAFELFKPPVSDEVKKIYNTYTLFKLSWECNTNKQRGFVNFVPYQRIIPEHENLCAEIDDVEREQIDNQDKVICDIKHWYPVFTFPNGDKFCYDDRTGKIHFYEHDVFDIGINLHGLVIADSIDSLFKNWSNILFVDIYDWSEGVNEHGIDICKEIFGFVSQ